MIDELLRPGFADELLARLERERRHAGRTVLARNVAAAALSASVVLVVAARRRGR